MGSHRFIIAELVAFSLTDTASSALAQTELPKRYNIYAGGGRCYISAQSDLMDLNSIVWAPERPSRTDSVRPFRQGTGDGARLSRRVINALWILSSRSGPFREPRELRGELLDAFLHGLKLLPEQRINSLACLLQAVWGCRQIVL
jgi:hypothetical protein